MRSLPGSSLPGLLAPLDNPIWRREWRSRFRDGRAMLLVLAFVVVFSLVLMRRYADAARFFYENTSGWVAARQLGQAYWTLVSWSGTLVALLIAPSLTASSIAFERERGLLEGLQMSPLRPLQIVLGKWLASLAFALLVWATLIPAVVLLVFIGARADRFGAVLGFHVLTLAFASAVGLLCSAWAHRAHFALRSAYGMLLLWALSSFGATYMAGESPLPLMYKPQKLWLTVWWGRTNPVLASLDIVTPNPLQTKWPYAVGFMALATLGCVVLALIAVRRPLEESPFIEKRAKPRPTAPPNASGVQGAVPSSHFSVPLVGALNFRNPVLGREVRGKFRVRQPPLVAIIAEVLLALCVGAFYVFLVWKALTDPKAHETVFYGTAITGLIVTLMACGTMGANGFAREREAGTWEGLQLSLLSPGEILRGKLGGALLSCVLFSLPAWPLLLVCVEWNREWSWWPLPVGAVTPAQLVTVTLVWVGSMLLATLWGLFIGQRAASSAGAAGKTLGGGVAALLGLPVVVAVWLVSTNELGHQMEVLLGTINPVITLLMSNRPGGSTWVLGTGVPFFAFALLVGFMLWLVVVGRLERELKRS